MDEIQAIQVKLLADIKQIDGGWETLSKKLGCTDRALEKVLKLNSTRKPRLATLEKISKGIKSCLDDQAARINALLA